MAEVTRPADVPEDVWVAATTALRLENTKAHMLAEPTDPLECIARAILVERQRCVDACSGYRERYAKFPASSAKTSGDNASLIIEAAINGAIL